MTKSDQIRKLSAEGHTRSQIAKSLGIRYQHVYNVLKRSGLLKSDKASPPAAKKPSAKAERTVESKEFKIDALLALGFEKLGNWSLGGSNEIFLLGDPPRKPGVYSFILDDKVVYVGVSERNLRNRLSHYVKPGSSMRTSIRVKKLILESLARGSSVAVVVMAPEDSAWKGLALPMHTALEAGLIREIKPAWNLQGL